MNSPRARFAVDINRRQLMTLYLLLCLALLPVAVSFAQAPVYSPMGSNMPCVQCDWMLPGQQGTDCGERDCTMPVCLTAAPILNVQQRLTGVQRVDLALYDIHLPPPQQYSSPLNPPLHRPPIT